MHTNIIAKDWKMLASFYTDTFGCKKASTDQNLKGEWFEKGVAIEGASLKGVQLLLPGHGDKGPTLEIFQYNENLEMAKPPAANREGYGHIAFHVEDVSTVLESMVEHGGSKLGEIVSQEFKSGTLTFTYALDPEGNIVELQNWSPK